MGIFASSKNGGDPSLAGCHVNKSTSILKEGAFLVALDGICTHGVGTTFRIGIACFFSAEMKICRFAMCRRFLKTQNALVGRREHSTALF